MDVFVKVFKALGDKTRLRILAALTKSKKELCICELMDTLKLAQYNISRHMKELKIAGIVSERKEGKFVFYSLAKTDNCFHGLIFESLKTFEDDILSEDNKRLKERLSIRKNGKCVIGITKCGR